MVRNLIIFPKSREQYHWLSLNVYPNNIYLAVALNA